jgi:hypothetical protein
MKGMPSQMQVPDFLVGHGGAGFVFADVEQGLHLESAACAGAADERDHSFVIHQRRAAPVDADEGKEPMLDL